MRVWQCGCHEEFEVLIVGDTLVSKAELAASVNLFEKNWLKGWVELFSDVLNQDPFAKLDAELEVPEQVAIAHLEDLKARCGSISAKELDKLVGLVLRINHERPPPRAEHDDTVLDGQIIVWKRGCRPQLGCDRIFEKRLHCDVRKHLHAQLSGPCSPLCLELLPELSGEGSGVCNHASANKAVANEIAVLHCKTSHSLCPTRLLACKTSDDLTSPLKLLVAVVDLGL